MFYCTIILHVQVPVSVALQHEWSISAVETKQQAETIITWHEGDKLEQAAAREAVQLRCVTGHCSVCSTGGNVTTQVHPDQPRAQRGPRRPRAAVPGAGGGHPQLGPGLPQLRPQLHQGAGQHPAPRHQDIRRGDQGDTDIICG